MMNPQVQQETFPISLLGCMTIKPTFIFATNNRHKTEEIRHILGDGYIIISLKEAGIDVDIPEPHLTLEANATEKSRTIHALTGQNCFSEDTGLEVDALNGQPGVRSARYAGEGRDFTANINKVLAELQGKENRAARFRTVISLIWNGQEYQFEGTCNGRIAVEPRGTGGFGYDPVFIPEGSDKTFAEMSLPEKNNYSHRRRATDQLVEFLKSNA
jgi:XTP/dITP diphosphohydrolase